MNFASALSEQFSSHGRAVCRGIFAASMFLFTASGCTNTARDAASTDPLPRGARLMPESRTDVSLELRRARAASLQAASRQLASARVRTALQLSADGTAIRLNTSLLTLRSLLEQLPGGESVPLRLAKGSDSTMGLKSAEARAAARDFFQKCLLWANAAAQVAMANLAAPPGSRRLEIAPFGLLFPGSTQKPLAALIQRNFRAFFPQVTGHALDVAPLSSRGDELFEVRTADGKARYVTMGRFYLTEDGRLVTVSGLLALGGKAVPVPRNALDVRIDTAGRLLATVPASIVKGQILGDTREKRLGTLVRVRFERPHELPIEQRGGEAVYAPAEAAGQMDRVDARESPLSLGVLLVDRRVDVRDETLVRQAEELRELALSGLRAVQTAGQLAQQQRSRKTARRTLKILANMPWTVRYLEATGKAPERNGDAVILDVSDSGSALKGLLGALDGIRLRIRVHRENVANAERTRSAEGKAEPYRRKVVTIGENGALRIEPDPQPFRQVYLPKHPDADKKGMVRFPNVFVKVEFSELEADVREFNLLRQAIGRLAPDLIIPQMPTPQRPSETGNGSGRE